LIHENVHITAPTFNSGCGIDIKRKDTCSRRIERPDPCLLHATLVQLELVYTETTDNDVEQEPLMSKSVELCRDIHAGTDECKATALYKRGVNTILG